MVLTAIVAVSACGEAGAGSASETAEAPASISAGPAATTLDQPEPSQSPTSTPPAMVQAAMSAPSSAPTPTPAFATIGPALPGVTASDLGQFTDGATLIDALVASGPLDNQLLTDPTLRPGVSICADIVQNHEPTVGTLVHEAIAMLNGQVGVVLVFLRLDGSREVRMYGTGDADPVTGGCPLLLQAPL